MRGSRTEDGVRKKEPFVYMLASRKNGTLYVGVTSDLIKRLWEHRTSKTGFTGKYGVFDLVYLEPHVSMEMAISREKQLKKWRRSWKMELIEKDNPEWNDLWNEILERY